MKPNKTVRIRCWQFERVSNSDVVEAIVYPWLFPARGVTPEFALLNKFNDRKRKAVRWWVEKKKKDGLDVRYYVYDLHLEKGGLVAIYEAREL